MSGYKRATISISEDEYRRLHDADMKLRFARKEQAKAASHPDSEQRLAALISQLTERQACFEEHMGSLGNELAGFEHETVQALVAQQTEFYGEYWDQLDGVRADMESLMTALSSQFQAQILAEHERRQIELTDIDRRLDSAMQSQRQKYSLAESWLNSAVALSQFIEEGYDDQRFAPRRLDGIAQELQTALENYQQGMPEAALLGAQQAYFRLSELRLELERLTSEWQVLYEMALQVAQRLYWLVTENSSCPALDSRGNELPIQIRLQDWAGNEYSSLVRRVAGFLKSLQADTGGHEIAELREFVAVQSPALEKEFESVVYQSRLAVINSQLRINIADIAVHALEQQGFVMDEAGYAQGDRHKPYSVTLHNIENSQVVIHVDPISDTQSTNALVVESLDSVDRTEHELRQRSAEIYGALIPYGLQVGPIGIAAQPPAELPSPAQHRFVGESRHRAYRNPDHD